MLLMVIFGLILKCGSGMIEKDSKNGGLVLMSKVPSNIIELWEERMKQMKDMWVKDFSKRLDKIISDGKKQMLKEVKK